MVRHLTAMVAADVVGYSRLMGDDEKAAARRARVDVPSFLVNGRDSREIPAALHAHNFGCRRLVRRPVHRCLRHALEMASSAHHWSITTHRKTSIASSITWIESFDRKANENQPNKEDSL